MDAKAETQITTYEDCKLSSAIEVNPAVARFAPNVNKKESYKPESSEAYFKHLNFVYMSKIVDGKINPNCHSGYDHETM